MAEMFGPRHEHRIGMILRETARLPRGSRTLEAAIGLGQMAARISAQGHRVFGIDNSLEALLHVRRELGLPVVLGSMEQLPFRTGSFDAITSGETLEHLPGDANAAAEFARVARRGALCVVTVPALEALRTFSDEYYEHLRRYSRPQLERLFSSSFEILKSRFWGFPVVLAYDTLFILPMNRRRARRGVSEDSALRGLARAGRAKWLVSLVRAAFSVDRLFSFLPIGVGLILVARRR